MATTTAPHAPSVRRLVPVGALAGTMAAVCTTAVAAIARAAGVSLEVDTEPIPLPAFAFWTLVGATVGNVLARFLRGRRRFVVVTVIGTALSLIPAMTLPDDTTTKAVLATAHVIAAAIIVPALGRRLVTVRSVPRTEEEK